MDQLNTNSKVAALEAAWQNGTAEAHCATLRHMATRVIQHDNVRGYNELRVALSEALLAKNTQARCKGHSPLQWVLGYEESLPGSVLERPQDLAAHSMALDEEDLGAAFRRRLQMREMARKAWIEMDNSDRIRQALTRRPQGALRTFEPGDQVYFYRKRRTKRNARAGAQYMPECWHGPAVVLSSSEDGKNVFLSWRHTLIKTTGEYLRKATEEEILAPQPPRPTEGRSGKRG